MIKSNKQAHEIQERRFKSGKRGFSKAARNFWKVNFPGSYQEQKSEAPVNW